MWKTRKGSITGFCLSPESSVCGRLSIKEHCSGPWWARAEHGGLQPGSRPAPLQTGPFWSMHGSTGCSFTGPCLLLWLDYQSDLWRRPLQMMWEGNSVAIAAFIWHILSVQSKYKNPFLNDVVGLLFYFSCLWNSVFFCAPLLGTPST